MLRFAVALAAYATRLIVPIVIGATSVGVALLLAVFPLHRVAIRPVCLFGLGCGEHTYYSQYAWQIPAATLIGVGGLAVAALIAFWNRWHPRSLPGPPVSRGWQASASESMLHFWIALVAYSARRALPFVMTVVAVVGAFFLFVTGQTPDAVLIGVIGLGLAFGIAVWNRWHPQARPLPPLPAGWQTGA